RRNRRHAPPKSRLPPPSAPPEIQAIRPPRLRQARRPDGVLLQTVRYQTPDKAWENRGGLGAPGARDAQHALLSRIPPPRDISRSGRFLLAPVRAEATPARRLATAVAPGLQDRGFAQDHAQARPLVPERLRRRPYAHLR